MTKRNDQPPIGPAEPHHTVAQVAAHYQVTPRTVRNWIAAGALRAWRKGDLIRIPHSALRDFDEQD